MLSELKDQGNKLQQEKNDAASNEVIKKINYACQWIREAFCPDTRDEYQKCFTIILMT
jgi:hypothetical protein